MLASEQLIDDLAGAVLDGAVVDWAAAESTAEGAAKPLVRHLRLVASVARLHRDVLPTETYSGALPAQPDAAIRDRWGHLKLFERAGRGAFGEVFRAWDTRLDREVALKLLPAPVASDNAAASSIIREGRLLAKVRHPNVVTIYGAEQIGREIGLWMEFVRGRTLEQLIKQGTAFRHHDVVTIGIELVPGRLRRARRRPAPSRHQGAERRPRRRRPHRPDGFRDRQGAGRQLRVGSGGHAAVSRAGSPGRRTGNGAERHLQPGRAALPPADGVVSRSAAERFATCGVRISATSGSGFGRPGPRCGRPSRA